MQRAAKLAALLESPATRIPPATMAIVAETMADTSRRLAEMAAATGQSRVASMLRMHATATIMAAATIDTGYPNGDDRWDSSTTMAAAIGYAATTAANGHSSHLSFHDVAALCAAHARVVAAMAGHTIRAATEHRWGDVDGAAEAMRNVTSAFDAVSREAAAAAPSALLRAPNIPRRTPQPAEHLKQTREQPTWDR